MMTAIKNRCSQFVLTSQDKENVAKFVRRIAKAEAMDYVTTEIAFRIAENSNGEMRTAANLTEALGQFVAGSGITKVTEEHINEALSTVETIDDQIAVRALAAVYHNKFRLAVRALLDVQDGFRLINTLLRLNSFLMNVEVLKGEKHKNVWWSDMNKDLRDTVKKCKLPEKDHLTAFNIVQSRLVELRMKSGAFMVPEVSLITDALFLASRDIQPMFQE